MFNPALKDAWSEIPSLEKGGSNCLELGERQFGEGSFARTMGLRRDLSLYSASPDAGGAEHAALRVRGMPKLTPNSNGELRA
jgi:hypothetical protein